MAINYSNIYNKIETDYSNLSEEELKKLKNKKRLEFFKSLNEGTSIEEEPLGYSSMVGDINKQINTTFTPFKSPKLSLTELAADEEFSETADRFLLAAGRDENIFEYLRDAEYSLGSAMKRSGETKNWTDEQKKDYAYLHSKFMNADVKGFRENLGMVKDMGVDMLLDPLNLLVLGGLAATGISGGTSTAGAVALGTSARAGLAAVTKEAAKQSIKTAGITGVEGGTWGGLHNYFIQDLNVEMGTQSQIDFGEVGLATGLGLGIGGTIGGGISTGMLAAKGRHYARFAEKEYKSANHSNVDLSSPSVTQPDLFNTPEFVGPQLRKKINEIHEIDEALNELPITEELINKADRAKNNAARASYFLLGKSTSEFIELVEDNPLVGDFLRKFRYDFDEGILKARTTGSKLNKTVNGPEQETTRTFGEIMGRTFGKYQYGMQRIINPMRRFGYFGKLSYERSNSLMTLLRDERLTSKKIADPKTGKVKYESNIEDFLDDGIYVAKVDGKDIDFKMSAEAIESFKGLRVLLDEGYDEAFALNLFQDGTNLKKGFLPRMYRYDILEKNREEFEQKLINAGHADIVTDKTPYKFDVKTLDNGVEKIETIEGTIHGDLGTDMNVFGRDFMKDAGDNVLDAKKLKARAIVSDMLDQRFTPFELQKRGQASGAGFLQARRFTNLKDNDIAKFLESDLETVLSNYFTNLSQTVARKKMFGATLAEWDKGTLQPILAAMRAVKTKTGTKKYTTAEVEDVGKRLERMFKRGTGLETFSDSPLRTNSKLSGFKDWALLSQQAALLPFATLSSITEPLILLSRVSVLDQPDTLGKIGYALGKQTESSFKRMFQGMKRTVGKGKDKLTGKVDESGGTRNIADLDDEVWSELYETGLALDQAVMERIEGLAGAGIEGGTAKKFQQVFFRTNFLTPWTKAVQLASFTTGKRIITQHARKLATGKSSFGKLTKSGTTKLRTELDNLGINPDDAIAWYKKSLDADGVFDDNLSKGINGKGGIINNSSSRGFGNDVFYKENVLGGANRFTKEIILAPKAAEANRPDWFGMPSSQFLIQFAGYPTVFNNTILKKMVNDLSPVNRKQKGGIEYNSNFHHNAAKTLGTVALMTTVAHWGNEIRSNGTNSIDRNTGLRKNESEILGSAIRRWGGFGPYDYISKFNNEQERGSGAPAALMKSLGGPLPQQLLDAVSYRKGFREMFATSLPYYGTYDVIFGEGTKKDLRAKARGTYKKDEGSNTLKYSSGKSSSSYSPFSKGGIVKNVPNVTDEPDEMRSRVTGQPFNETSEAAQDIEDRELKGQIKGLRL